MINTECDNVLYSRHCSPCHPLLIYIYIKKIIPCEQFLDSDFEKALEMFSRQLADPLFLVNYIHRLDETQKTHRKNR